MIVPCNCDHLEPNQYEKESRKLMMLLKEVGLHEHDIPFYGEASSIHEYTAMLCEFCQTHDVTDYSLELQIWWRDHEKADQARIISDLEQAYDEIR
jgi:hypothetical protein